MIRCRGGSVVWCLAGSVLRCFAECSGFGVGGEVKGALCGVVLGSG